MTEEIVELTTRIPKWLHTILTQIKEKLGQSINSQLVLSTIRQYVMLGYISLDEIRIKSKKSQKETKIIPQAIPESLKYCDSEICEIPLKIKEDVNVK